MKDRSPIFLVIAVSTILVAGIALYQLRSKSPDIRMESESKKEQQESGVKKILRQGEYPSFVTGEMEPGNIRLELKPVDFENGVLTIRFFASAHDLVLDSYDFGFMTTLLHNGRNFRPVSADRLKGHHGSGLMSFNIGEDLGEFSITVEGLPKEEHRIFKW